MADTMGYLPQKQRLISHIIAPKILATAQRLSAQQKAPTAEIACAVLSTTQARTHRRAYVMGKL
jgi:hypothetical protein